MVKVKTVLFTSWSCERPKSWFVAKERQRTDASYRHFAPTLSFAVRTESSGADVVKGKQQLREETHNGAGR